MQTHLKHLTLKNLKLKILSDQVQIHLKHRSLKKLKLKVLSDQVQTHLKHLTLKKLKLKILSDQVQTHLKHLALKNLKLMVRTLKNLKLHLIPDLRLHLIPDLRLHLIPDLGLHLTRCLRLFVRFDQMYFAVHRLVVLVQAESQYRKSHLTHCSVLLLVLASGQGRLIPDLRLHLTRCLRQFVSFDQMYFAVHRLVVLVQAESQYRKSHLTHCSVLLLVLASGQGHSLALVFGSLLDL